MVVDLWLGLHQRSEMDSVSVGATLAFIDLIDFRRTVNEPYGHDVGDQVLQGLADRLRTRLAPNRVFRSGGDEFMVEIAEGLDHYGAIAFAERLVGLVREPFDALDRPLEPRIGIASRPIGDDPIRGLWFAAETAGGEARKANEPYWIDH